MVLRALEIWQKTFVAPAVAFGDVGPNLIQSIAVDPPPCKELAK
jgi:hypothetical protein